LSIVIALGTPGNDILHNFAHNFALWFSWQIMATSLKTMQLQAGTLQSAPKTETPWLHWAIGQIEADFQRSADTHLIALPLPKYSDAGIDFYFKDESTHPTGSLKHRLGRSLFLYALCNGWVKEGQTIIEASSGSTAVSEAYFARLLGLPFIAFMPKTTSPEKIAC
jgi:cysteine synthase